MIYVFTGNGKGKTTAALGVGLRAVGAGLRVFLIQFLKSKSGSSEEKVIRKIKNFEIKSFGRKGFYLPKKELEKHPEFKKYGVKPFTEKDYKLARDGLELAEKVASSKKYDVLILDEINMALHFKLISKSRLINFLKKYRDRLNIILTGRSCPKDVIKIADLVTEMKETKHYYKKGVPAQKGIDY